MSAANKGQAMPKKQRRIKVRTKKRRRATMLTILLLFVVLFAAGFVGYRYLRADHIQIGGNKTIPASEIIALSGIKTGTHLLELDRDAARQAIEQNPYLEVESIDFILPDTVAINVRERAVTSVIRQLERTICLDTDGRVLDIIGADGVSGILVVKGVAVTGCTLNQTIALVDDYQLEVLNMLVTALLDTNQYSTYAEADLTYSVDIWLTTHEGMRVRLGQAVDLSGKLKKVSDVIAELYGKGVSTGTLIATSADAVTFSPEEDVQDEEQQEGETPEPEGETKENPSEPGE